jgi:hypothetical protein
MKISAKVIADSISPDGDRLTTMECTFHRFILPEVNTYRMWSRNAASSRAIPLKRRIKEVRENPAIPVHWGLNEKGMVASEELPIIASTDAFGTWMEAAMAASDYAEILLGLNLHKQTASRILEPFLWHTSVISSTNFSNCFEQRIHADAQPEFRLLAIEMKKAIDDSVPVEIGYREWHLPYLSDNDTVLSEEDKKKVCVARVARSSYLNQDKTNIEADLELYERLVSAEPPHLSPFEMVATPAVPGETVLGNFDGWHQFRHLV